MKKLLLGLVAMTLVFTACNDEQIVIEQEQVDMSDFYVYTETVSGDASKNNANGQLKSCYSMEMLNKQLDEIPGLYKKMYDIELHTRQFIAGKGKPPGTGGGGGGNGGGNGGGDPDPDYTAPVSIPVIINILENNNGDVSQAQINSQINILNEDFNDNNPNTSSAPSEFSSLVADCKISFTLAGVNRKISTKSSWGTNNSMKYSSQGGIDATDPSTYLNIWVCNIGGGILGYAQFPGGPTATDGVVIGNDYFGETSGVYGDGRTATHEVGHYLNLRHIWGDGNCRQDDFVADTPSSNGPNYGCPSYPTINCRTADMTMNYMDYVYDNCMYMFTSGQNSRMRALFTSGGDRASLVN